MAIPPPPPGFSIVSGGGSPMPNRPILRRGRAPQAKIIQDGQIIDPNTGTATPVAGFRPKPNEGKITWRPASPSEARRYGQPGQVSSTGEFKPLPPPKNDLNSADKMRDSSLALLKAAGVDLRRGVDPVSDLIKGSTSGILQHYGAEAKGAITGSATPGMENIGKLQTIVSDMTLQLTGGSLGNQISNSDRDFIMQRVGNLADPDVPANQRLAAWMQVKRRMANLTGAQMPAAKPKPKQPIKRQTRVIDFNDLP